MASLLPDHQLRSAAMAKNIGCGSELEPLGVENRSHLPALYLAGVLFIGIILIVADAD